jgi:uncharacterized protein (TIGR02453 family)
MIETAIGFFQKLRADNTRDFFEAHKAFYEQKVRKPATLMAELFAEDLTHMTGRGHVPKVFRIHRDVRFTKDKTPYNTHLHVMWSRPGDAVSPSWFFGASPDYLTFGMGVMDLRKDALARYRRMIDEDGDDLGQALGAAETKAAVTLSDWGPEPLKRVPGPYAPDHRHADLLRRKAFAIHAPLPVDWHKVGLLPSLNWLAPDMLPVWRILDRAFPG